jgi:methionyl-tRNA formyltransferase
MKIVFMGTPEFSVAALDGLVSAGHEIVAVYTQPPRPSGRGQKERKTPVHMAATRYGLIVKTPKTLKNESEFKEFTAFDADMVIVVAYGLILPKNILEICPCINIHASILPRWRGAAPIQRAILAGDMASGVTIMHMDEGLDTGDVLLYETVPINNDLTAGDLHDILSVMGKRLILQYIETKDSIDPIKQSGEETYANKIDKAEAKINFENTVSQISRQIRAFNPHPGAYFFLNGEKVKILTADTEQRSHDYIAGKIIDDKLSISCLDGVVYPKIIQREGKKAMHVLDMLRGLPDSKDAIVS